MDAEVVSMENTAGAPEGMTDALVEACGAFADTLEFCGMPDSAKVLFHYEGHTRAVQLTYTKNAEGDGYDAKAELVKRGDDDNRREFNTDPF